MNTVSKAVKAWFTLPPFTFCSNALPPNFQMGSLLLQACSNDQKDVVQRFLEDLPLAMRLGSYVDWQPYRVDEFIERLTIAKSDIDNHKFSSGKSGSGETTTPSPNPDHVFNQIQQLLVGSGLDVQQIRQILEALLESL